MADNEANTSDLTDGKAGQQRRAGQTGHAELTVRIEMVAQMIIQGAKRQTIWQYVQQKTNWGIGQRTLDRYLRSAEERIKEILKESREMRLAKAMARYDDLYLKCYNVQDYKTAAQINEKMIDLSDLKEAVPMDADGKRMAPPSVRFVKRSEPTPPSA
jgi:hypothetical protein